MHSIPSKSMTIGTLLDNHVDSSRTASLFGSGVVVIAVVVPSVVVAIVVLVVVVKAVVVEATVVVGSMHS